MDGFESHSVMRLPGGCTEVPPVRGCHTLGPDSLPNLNLVSLPRSITCRKRCEGHIIHRFSLPWDVLFLSQILRPWLTCQLFFRPAPSPPTRVTEGDQYSDTVAMAPTLPSTKELFPEHLLLSIPSQQVNNSLKIRLEEISLAKTFSHCT